jgi:hypothetical protein
MLFPVKAHRYRRGVPILVMNLLVSITTQIDYFNQRRIIAAAQKDRLSRVSEQSHVMKK